MPDKTGPLSQLFRPPVAGGRGPVVKVGGSDHGAAGVVVARPVRVAIRHAAVMGLLV